MRAGARQARHTMSTNNNNEKIKPMEENRESADNFKLDRRLVEEINILKLEGSLFCFDPKEAKRRAGKLTLADTRKNPVTIDIHPTYGQPSVLAYKVLQAIFLKMTEEGYPYPNTVSFTQRELARLVGRNSWGGNDGRQIYDAVMQLHRT